ncbi:MAG: GYD domain-containing protein [Methanomicrobiales archaeon]|nr:GYD domain-containing protein [Methanomicrobiales archaeon]
MLTFILLGRLTSLALEQAREFKERDRRAADIIKKSGGNLVSLYYTYGQYDFVAIIEAPSQDVMTMILFEIGRFSTVSSETLMAIPPDHLYKIIENFPEYE